MTVLPGVFFFGLPEMGRGCVDIGMIHDDLFPVIEILH